MKEKPRLQGITFSFTIVLTADINWREYGQGGKKARHEKVWKIMTHSHWSKICCPLYVISLTHKSSSNIISLFTLWAGKRTTIKVVAVKSRFNYSLFHPRLFLAQGESIPFPWVEGVATGRISPAPWPWVGLDPDCFLKSYF